MASGGVKNLVVKGYINNEWQTGGLIGRIPTVNAVVEISRCGVEMDITNKSDYGTGAFVGAAGMTVIIKDSYTKSNIHGKYIRHNAFIGLNNSIQTTTIMQVLLKVTSRTTTTDLLVTLIIPLSLSLRIAILSKQKMIRQQSILQMRFIMRHWRTLTMVRFATC